MKTFLAALVALMAVLIAYIFWEDTRVLKVDATQAPSLLKVQAFAPIDPDKPAPEKAVLRLLTWKGYIPDSVFERLRIETGIRVISVTFTSNEEFWEKINAKDEHFDIAMPADYIALRLDRTNRTKDIDYTRITNQKNISAGARRNEQLSPLFRCSVPFIFGTIGIGYNPKFVGRLPLQWMSLFDPPTPQLLRARMGLIDDPRQALGIALLALHYSPNTRDPKQIAEAGKLIKDCMTHLTRLANRRSRHAGSSMLADELKEERLYLTMVWGGDVARVMDENKSLRFISPDEGALLLLDCFVVMREAEKTPGNVEAAEELINFMLRPEISAEVTNFSHFATLNEAATPYVSRLLFNGPAYYLPRGKQLHFRTDVEDAEQTYRDVWADVRKFYEERVRPTLDHGLGFEGHFVDGNDEYHSPAPAVEHASLRAAHDAATAHPQLDSVAPVPEK